MSSGTSSSGLGRSWADYRTCRPSATHPSGVGDHAGLVRWNARRSGPGRYPASSRRSAAAGTISLTSPPYRAISLTRLELT